MPGVPEDDELEIVPIEGAARPPPPPSPVRRAAAWAGRHRRPLLAVAVVVVLLVTAYAWLAVRGLRALERQTRAAVALREQYDAFVAELRPARPTSYRLLAGDDADTRVRRATAEYGVRMGALADRAVDVTIVDPALRQLRRRTVAFLRGEASRARTASTRTSPWLSPVRFDTTRLDAALRWWRRPPGDPPRIRLASVTAPRRPVPLLGEPTGARLFVPTREGLLEVEVDSGSVHTHGDGGTTQWAVGDGFLATVEAGNGIVRRFGGRGGDRPVGRYDLVLNDSGDPRLVWFVTGPGEPTSPRTLTAHAVDRDGTRHGEALPGDGMVTALSDRWLVRARYGDDDEVVVDDRRTGREVARLRNGGFHALGGDSLVWSDGRRLVLRNLADGTEQVVPPPRPDLRPWTVTTAPDGGRLAVVWAVLRGQDGDLDIEDATLVVHDVRSRRMATVLPTVEDSAWTKPAWSRDGRWLFVLVGSEAADSRVLAWRDGLAEPKAVQIEGRFFGLAAF